MRLPEAIIFDLDDSGAMEACWLEVCREGADRLEGADAQILMKAIARQRDWFWSDPERHREGRMDLRAATRAIVEKALLNLVFDQPRLAREIAEGYRDLREERLCPLPGAIETLDRLRAKGVRLGLITNGRAAGQGAKIDRFGLAPYFEHILIEGEFGLGKPPARSIRGDAYGVIVRCGEDMERGRQSGVGRWRAAAAGYLQRLGRCRRDGSPGRRGRTAGPDCALSGRITVYGLRLNGG